MKTRLLTIIVFFLATTQGVALAEDEVLARAVVSDSRTTANAERDGARFARCARQWFSRRRLAKAVGFTIH